MGLAIDLAIIGVNVIIEETKLRGILTGDVIERKKEYRSIFSEEEEEEQRKREKEESYGNKKENRKAGVIGREGRAC